MPDIQLEDFATDVTPPAPQPVEAARGEPAKDSETGFANYKTPAQIVSSAEFLADYHAPAYVVDGIIQRGFLYALTAKTGHGKTAVALKLAHSIATGTELAGHSTRVGRVLYMAGENPDDLRGRWLLGADRYGFNPNNIDVHFIAGTFSIDGFIGEIKTQADDLGGFDAIFVDTSAAYFIGAGFDEENSNTQIGKWAQALQLLTELPGSPTVVVLCHPTKNPASDNLIPRGGGAFIAAIDGNLTLWATTPGEVVKLHWQGKYRGPNFEPLMFRLETGTCDALKDAYGRNLPSVVAVPIDDAQAEALERQGRSQEDTVLATMLANPKASVAELATKAGWLTDKGQPMKSRVHRVLEALKTDSLVKMQRKRWALSDAGKKAAEEVNSTDAAGFIRS